jgi:hypothetical protein
MAVADFSLDFNRGSLFRAPSLGIKDGQNAERDGNVVPRQSLVENDLLQSLFAFAESVRFDVEDFKSEM